MKNLALLAVAALTSVAASAADASVLITFQQKNDDVQVSASGSLDTSYFEIYKTNTTLPSAYYTNVSGTVRFAEGKVDIYKTSGKATQLGLPPLTYYFSSPNSAFGIYAAGVGALLIAVPAGYVSGSQISASALITSNTIKQLHISASSFENVLPGNQKVDYKVLTAVPEPANWALMLGGFGLIGAALRRRAPRIAFAH